LRKAGHPDVTRTTARLLEHWTNPDRSRRLFFCQIEAMETVIYIAEVARKYGDTWIENDLRRFNEDANPDLFRIACKMATGSGKTVIMAMLIAWQTLNKLANGSMSSNQSGEGEIRPTCGPPQPGGNVNMKAKSEPFLRWAGSKRKQVSLLTRFWNPDFGRYIEPFMGSACLFFALQPQQAILADTNGDLIRTFLAVRDHPQAVANRLAKLPRRKRSYYSIRKQRLADMEPVDAAASFIFLNRFCFNGLYRTNKDGRFNVPYASARVGRLSNARELNAVSQR
jgi:hypothetical protein